MGTNITGRNSRSESYPLVKQAGGGGGGGGGGGTPAPPLNAVQFNNPLGTFAGSANLLFTTDLELHNGARLALFAGATAFETTFTFAGAVNVPYVLPPTQGALHEHLENDGTGTLTWGLTGYTDSVTNNNALGINANPTVSGTENVAIGHSSLTPGVAGDRNVAVGNFAMNSAFSASECVAVGWGALGNGNNQANDLVAIGVAALTNNTTGILNVAVGPSALSSNTVGASNVAVGDRALNRNVSGNSNIGIGTNSLVNSTTGSKNIGIGDSTCVFALGASENIAIGQNAMLNNVTGSSNVAIGVAAGAGIFANFNTCVGTRSNCSSSDGGIAIGISSTNVPAACNITDGLFFPPGRAVVVAGVQTNYNAATGQMGPIASSRRFKEDIVDLTTKSALIFDLRPVDYKYKNSEHREFGYIAEEVAEVLPCIVPRDAEGAPFGVNYEKVVVLLVEELRKTRDSLANALSDIAALKTKIL